MIRPTRIKRKMTKRKSKRAPSKPPTAKDIEIAESIGEKRGFQETLSLPDDYILIQKQYPTRDQYSEKAQRQFRKDDDIVLPEKRGRQPRHGMTKKKKD